MEKNYSPTHENSKAFFSQVLLISDSKNVLLKKKMYYKMLLKHETIYKAQAMESFKKLSRYINNEYMKDNNIDSETWIMTNDDLNQLAEKLFFEFYQHTLFNFPSKKIVL